MVNDALEHAQVAERVDHRSYERQGLDIEPTVTMGHTSASLARRAARAQIAAGEATYAVTPRGQLNGAVVADRESVGVGTSGSVRVHLGVCHTIKKNKNQVISKPHHYLKNS